jgi:hypothetical protein
MKKFIQITLAVYCISLLVFSFWGGVTFQNPELGWIGSLAYLPHGCKVIFITFFGIRAVPALFFAEFTGQFLEWPNTDLFYLWVGSISSLLCVLAAVNILTSLKIGTDTNLKINKRLTYKNYKFIIFVIILSALFNSIFTNLVLSIFNGVNIGVEVIARFFIGDVLGSAAFIIFLMILFNLLQQRRLYKVHED